MSQLPQEEKINRIRRIILDSREGVEEQHPELGIKVNLPLLEDKLVNFINEEIAVEVGILSEEKSELLERGQQQGIALEKAIAIIGQLKEYYEANKNETLTKTFYEDIEFINKAKRL